MVYFPGNNGQKKFRRRANSLSYILKKNFKYFLYFLFFCHFHSLSGALYRVDHGILLVVKATFHDFFDTIESIFIEFELASLYYSLLHVMDNLDGPVFK